MRRWRLEPCRTYSPFIRPITSKIDPAATKAIKDASGVCAGQSPNGRDGAKLRASPDFDKGSQVQILSARPMNRL